MRLIDLSGRRGDRLQSAHCRVLLQHSPLGLALDHHLLLLVDLLRLLLLLVDLLRLLLLLVDLLRLLLHHIHLLLRHLLLLRSARNTKVNLVLHVGVEACGHHHGRLRGKLSGRLQNFNR